MPLLDAVMKSTQALVEAIGPLCDTRLKIIEIVHRIIVLKSGKNGLGNKPFRTEWLQTKATLTNYIKLFTLFIHHYLPVNATEMKSDPSLFLDLSPLRK